MAASSRESRRRRIVERGADRLAFIQGRLNTFPTEPEIVPSPASVLPAQDLPPSVSDQATESALPEVPKPDLDADSGPTNDSEGGIVEELESNTAEPRVGGSNPAFDSSKEVDPLLASLADQISSISPSRTRQSSESLTRRHNPFSPKQISSAISLSERIRLFCSLAIAMLVVSSQMGFPLLQSGFVKSIIGFGPLYLVLLTNVTIVIVRLLLRDHGARERRVIGENTSSPADDFGWAEQLGKTLELGLLMQKAIDAVFMDCSVFALVIVFGLSFA